MNILDVMNLPSFASAKVVTGNEYLDRTVTSAMILEAIDIEKWGKRGQLIITSYFALQDLDEAELEVFFCKIDAIGISGIIFKMERLVRHIPAPMVRLCEEHNIPLISVNKAVKYESLLMDIFGTVLESNLTLLNHFYAVHQQIMELATTQPTIYQILVSLKHSIHDEITFFDSSLSSKTSTANAPSNFISWDLTKLEAEQYQNFARYSAILKYDGERQNTASVIEVPAHEPNRYYLIIHTGNHMLSRIDTMTIENFASLLQMETLKQNALEQQLFIQHNNTTLDLLLSRYSSHEKIDNALKNLGIDTSPLYQVLLIHIRTLHSEDEHRKCDILAAIKRGVRSQYSNLAYFVSNDRIVFLHNHENELSQFKKTLIQSLLSTLHSDPTLPAFTHISAISDSTDRYSIGSINKEVLNIYQIFSSTSLKNHCMRYSDLGCLRVFLNVEDYASLRETIDPRILKLYDENPEQFTTLVALCESNLHYQDTAKQLFLHPKTVRYRIDQIESTYGLSVHDPDDFLQILLAGKIIILTETAV